MKKRSTGLSLILIVIIAVAVTAFTQQQKDKNKKDPQQTQNKGNQGKPEVKGNQGNKDNKGNQGNQGNQDNKDNKGNQGNQDNKGNKDNQGNQGNQGKGNDNANKDYDYTWNRETFKDRHKIKNQGKVTLCHKFNRDGEPGVTISVSSHALKAHLNHGDVMGNCPFVKSRYSDDYLRKRTDYYGYIQENQEQVLYSRSILDYALGRLTESRQQLVVLESNNMPPAEIERKRVAVVELEQNVTLLQTLVDVAARVVADKLF